MYPSSQRLFPKSCVSAGKSLEKVCGRYGIGFQISRLENHTHDGLRADVFAIPYYNTIREYFLIEYNNISIVKLHLEFRVLLTILNILSE